MSRPKALMICTNYWTSPTQVGSHQLARELLERGWEVAFLSDPLSPLHLAKGITADLRERFALYRAGGLSGAAGRLWAYVPAALFVPHNRPLLRGAWVARHWQRFSFPSIVREVGRRGFGEVDLLYFDNWCQPCWLECVRFARSVYRIPDYSPGHAKWTQAGRTLEEELARTVDLVVYAAASLRDYASGLSPRQMLHLPNGIHYRHFADDRRAAPPEYQQIARPIAVYVGVLNGWVDYDLLDRCAARLPRVSFVLIGRQERLPGGLKARSNVFFLGPRPFADLPPYLRHADVGLIPFAVKSYTDLINRFNPLKLYEYLACGLPVVSATWQELRTLQSPAVLCENDDDFVQAVGEAVARPAGIEANRLYAAARDWGSRLETLLEALDLNAPAATARPVAAGFSPRRSAG